MTSFLMETELTPHQVEIVDTIRTSGDTLLTLINDILDFSKIEAGKLELENQPFNVRLCVEEALDLLASKASEKGLELAYHLHESAPSTVVGDVTRLRQILVNLISNGIKFTTTGEVIVRAGMVGPDLLDSGGAPPKEEKETIPGPGETCFLHFSVTDTGMGIAPEKVSRLFKSFSQVDASVTRQFGGTGLGLAISKNLAALMGGKMWVESSPGQGSTFHFTIRCQVSPPVSEPPLVELKERLKGLRVLVVDDNPTNRRILILQTSNWGMKPSAASSGKEALEWLRVGEPFDLAILDMQMPHMDGATLAGEIRNLRSASQLPLVLLTSMGVKSGAPEMSVFAATLSKPVKHSVLQEVLLKTVDKSRLISKRSVSTLKLDSTLASRIPLRLLLVDDNAINQKVALRLFQQMGYQADVAGNGIEAVDAVRRKTYDIVFMDVQMPEMDGLEATRQIRNWERARPATLGAPLVIVAMTANAMQGDREKCLQSGMNDYLPKPVRPETLQTAMEQWGGKLQARRNDLATHSQRTPSASPAAKPAPIPGSIPSAGPGVAASESSNAHRVPAPASVPVAPRPNTSPLPAGAKLPVEGPPPVDMERLAEFTSGDNDSLTELISLYLGQTTEQLAKLRSCIENGSTDEVRKVAHSCAGSSATCGMTAMVPSLREIERVAMGGALEGAMDLLIQSESQFERVKTFLAQQGSMAVS